MGFTYAPFPISLRDDTDIETTHALKYYYFCDIKCLKKWVDKEFNKRK